MQPKEKRKEKGKKRPKNRTFFGERIDFFEIL
jgi:hypothetical protein